MTYEIEVTDLYGGEPNYCWVKRKSLPDDYTQGTLYGTPAYRRRLVMAAKAFAGWTGLRCKVDNYGDMIEIRPSGLLQVAFIQWRD